MKSTQSERLNALKEIHRFTDQQLGDILGLTQPAARNIRMGLAKLTVEYATIIANKYHVNRNWLLLGEGAMNSNIKAGVPITEIQKQLRHTSLETTQEYLQSMTVDLNSPIATQFPEIIPV